MSTALRSHRRCSLVLVVLTLSAVPAMGQFSQARERPADPDAAAQIQLGPSPPAESQPADARPASQPARAERYAARSWGTRLETEPPGYVKTLDQLAPGLEEFDWLYFGLEQRLRWEYRDDDYRRPDLTHDDQFLLRSRAFLGIKKILDPFRFAIEFQDSRQFNSQFPETSRDVDEADFIQMYGELYFKDALGPGEPLTLRAGRMSLEYAGRRWVARNQWRNTTNAFDAMLLRLGEPASDWQFDFFAAMPVERRLRQPDRSDEESRLYGMVGAWRKWSEVVTLEPYYFILDADRKPDDQRDQEIHTLGMRVFGPIAKTGFDYDADVAFQVGDDGALDQRAFFGYGEVGYTVIHPWHPRLSVTALYGSGDGNPDDSVGERVFRLYDATHSLSTWDYITRQNIISPKVRFDFQPHPKLRLVASYGPYWLASDNDAWVIPGRSDPTGESGDFIGQEIDLVARWQVNPRVELEAGYAYFIPGDFVKNTGDADDGDFFYLQTTVGLYPK